MGRLVGDTVAKRWLTSGKAVLLSEVNREPTTGS